MKATKRIKMNKYIVIFSSLILSACGNSNTEVEIPTEELSNTIVLTETQKNTIGLTIDTVGLVNIPMVKQLNGFIDVPPEKKITLSAPIGGFIEKMDVLNGMKVRKGQFLLSLKDQSFIQLQEQYLTTYHQWKVDKANYERQEALAAEKINAVKSLEQARASYDASSVMLEGMRARLKMMNVNITQLEAGKILNTYNLYAPIEGYVSNIVVNKGKYVSNAEALIDIVDVSSAYASLTVFEKDLANVTVGQKVKLLLSDGVTELPAKISFIGKTINEDRSLNVICSFTQSSEKIIPGMYLTAFLEMSNQWVLGVPSKAVVNFQLDKFVFVPTANENEFEPIKIETTNFNSEYTSIGNNERLVPGSKVVLVGAYDLLSKWKNSEED